MSNEIIKKKQFNIAIFIIWTVFFASIIFGIIYILPRKGIEFTDTGYYLYNSWIISKGVIAEYGYGSILNAPFMLLGIYSILFYNIWYIALICISVCFLWSRVKPISSSILMPLSIFIAIVLQTIFLASYHTAPDILILLGAAFLYTRSSNVFFNCLFLIISAFFLVLFSLSSLSLLPMIFFLAIFAFIYLRDKGVKEIICFYVSYIVFFVILFLLYTSSDLSLFNVDRLNAYYHPTIIGLVKKIPSVLEVLFDKFFLVLCALALLGRMFSNAIVGLKKNNLQGIVFIALVFLLIVYYSHTSWIHDPLYQKALFFKAMILATIFFTSTDKNNILMFVSYTVLLSSLLISLTARANIFFHLFALFPVSCISVVSLFVDTSRENRFGSIVALLYFIFMLYIAYFALVKSFIGSNYRSYPTFDVKEKINSGVGKNIFANANKVAFIKDFANLYNKYNCKSKYFFAYPALPMLYYMVHRRAPGDNAWVSSVFKNMSDAQIIEAVSQNKHWCIIVANGFNYAPGKYTKVVSSYLYKHSKHVIIKAKSKPVNLGYYPWQYTFYVN